MSWTFFLVLVLNGYIFSLIHFSFSNFSDSLTENNEKLIEFALGGICNFINGDNVLIVILLLIKIHIEIYNSYKICFSDPEIEKTVLNSDGLKLIIDCLKM